MTPSDIEKSRKKFEANIKILAEKEKYRYMDILLDRYEEGDYKMTWVSSAWIGWQLRQNSLVVELPKPDCIADSNGYPHFYYEPEVIISMLQSAGINYRERE